MTSFAASSWRLLRRVVGGGKAPRVDDAAVTILDGLTAVALTEARIADVAATGSTYPAATAGRVWSREAASDRLNDFGRVLGVIDCADARGGLAAAIGASLAGERATAFLSGPDLAAVGTDLLTHAAGRHVPLVVHVVARATASHAEALGSGHEAYHAASDAGWVQLCAINAQEAVDLALVSRRVAEQSLTPAMVVMDAEQTGLAAQDVRVPGGDVFSEFVGAPFAAIETPTEGQRLVFGATRRRVPRLHDLERPLMIGSLQGTESWALGAAARRPWFDQHVPRILDDALEEFAARTGRCYDRLVEHQMEAAEIILVAQGSAVETAIAVADHARRHEHLRVGVLGVRCLRPLPSAAIAAALQDAGVVAVLERVDTPLAGDGPLLREIRGTLDRAAGTSRGKRRSRLVGVPFGLGGLPLRGADLLELLRRLPTLKQPICYLGLEFTRSASVYPKHQALLDAVRRADPQLETLGLRSTAPPPPLLPEGAIAVAIHRLAGHGSDTTAGDFATMMHRVLGGSLRSRPGLTWQRFGQPCVDWLFHGPKAVGDPGDDALADIAVGLVDHPSQIPDLTQRLADDGVILLANNLTDDLLIEGLPPTLRDALAGSERRLLVVSPAEGQDAAAWEPRDALLGAVIALSAQHEGRQLSAAQVRDACVAQDRDRAEPATDAIVHGFESARVVEVPATGVRVTSEETPLPSIVRRFDPRDGTFDCLPRFWDHTGIFYRDNAVDELVAEPCLALGAVPPLTSTFRDASTGRVVLPVFDPETCTATPALWMSCPDASVVPLVISVRRLIDAGIAIASERGQPADALRAIASKLATAGNRLVRSAEQRGVMAAMLLTESCHAVLGEMDPPTERRASLEQAMSAVIKVVGELRFARTEIFFDEPDREKRGSGELFALLINPDTCKSPELILAHGEGRGLCSAPQTPDDIVTARRLWKTWELLPDTSGTTIERARRHPDIGPLAALMLSRHCSQAAAGGDGAESASGARLALRLVLGIAEFHYQPRLQEHLEHLEQTRQRLSDRIREVLADALPVSDLDGLSQGLSVLGQDDFDIAALSSAIDDKVALGRLDGARLNRLVEVARGLVDLHWHLTKGPDGLGRARLGLAIAPGAVARWAGVFPSNPFQCPTHIDPCGEIGAVARGLLDGQLRQSLAGIRLLRWAEAELETPDAAAATADALRGLRFSDLDERERRLCPPMLVVGDDRDISRDLGRLIQLLESDTPVKILVLSESGGAADGGLAVDAFGSHPSHGRIDLALLALLARRAYVVQTSLAHPEHLAEGVQGALQFDGPALVVVHTPSPQRNGFAPTDLFDHAALAVTTRAHPLLKYDPVAGGVFGSCLDLAGNPVAESTWATVDEHRLTPVDWAITETRFAEHLHPLPDDAPGPLPVASYLDLDADERQGRTPFVESPVDGSRMMIGAALIADADDRRRLWRTLQELAGVVTPFTDDVRAEARREVADAHATEIARLDSERQTRETELRTLFELEATQRVTDGLLALVNRANGAAGAQDGDA